MRALLTWQIAFRNLARNGRRFLLLGVAITAGFFLICSLQSLVSGLAWQINTRGARYYGGHVIIRQSQNFPVDVTIAQADQLVLDAIAHAQARPAAISHRTHFGADGVVFFNGESVRIRRVIGMDWSTEGDKIRGLQIMSGNLEEMKDPRGALISEVTARRLGARVGDMITLQVNREGGAVNTVPVLVKAVFREVSIFGYYTVYMDRGVLDEALGLDPHYSATVGVYLDDYRTAGRVATHIFKTLEGRYTVQPVINLMPELRTLVEALTLVSYGVLTLLSIVTAMGILNLYRVIIYERTREIGTMRAIGTQRRQVRNVVFCEAFLLALCSVGAGLLFSVVVLSAVSSVRLNGAAGLDIFLVRGHLSWVLYPDSVGAEAVLIILVTMVGAFSPARAAQMIDPAVALRAE